MAPEDQFIVSTSDGVALACRIRRCPHKARDGLIVLVHGRLHNQNKGPLAIIEDRLGHDTFAFDARGMGDSDGVTGYSNTEQERDDLKIVLQHLLDRGETVIAVVGHSKGAVVALMLASIDPSLCPLVVSVSARYDARDSSAGVARFSEEQQAALERDGQFTWLSYRVGDGSQKRPYIVTRQDIDSAALRSLVCCHEMDAGVHTLLVHGKDDGTVPYANSQRIDGAIAKSGATSDLMLFEGVQHNWDGDGQAALLGAIVGSWIEQRHVVRAVKRAGPLIDHLGHDRHKLNVTTSA